MISRIAWPALAVACLAYATGALLLASVPMETLGGPTAFWPELTTSLSWVFYAAVGALIVSRRPHNAVGWLFLVMGVLYALRVLAYGFVNRAVFVDDALMPVAAALGWMVNLWVVPFGLFPLLFLLFPTGRLPSRRWRPVALVMPPATVLGVAWSSIEVGGHRFDVPLIDELVAATGLFGEVLDLLGDWLFMALFIPAAAALVVRLRRSGGLERQQLKWFVYACLVFVACILGIVVAFIVAPWLDPAAPYPAGMFLGIPAALALTAIPAAAAVAILRHRLFDIDLVIRRTLVYGALTALLASVYVSGVLFLSQLLGGLTGGDQLAVATSTLAAATLFRPLRRRVQRGVDRRFYRSRYDAVHTIEGFGARLREELELDSLTGELQALVDTTVQPSQVSVWLRR